MTDYKHLTGKRRAEQEWFLGDLPEHDTRSDFIDDAHLLALDADLELSGVPAAEGALPDAKAAMVSEETVVVDASGTTTNLVVGSTRTITATLKRAGATVEDDDATVVTFSKDSGTGSVTGLGNATVTDGVATKVVTASDAGTMVIKVAAPGYTSGTTVAFTIDAA